MNATRKALAAPANSPSIGFYTLAAVAVAVLACALIYAGVAAKRPLDPATPTPTPPAPTPAPIPTPTPPAA